MPTLATNKDHNLDSLILDNLLDDHTYIAVFDREYRFVRASAAYEKTFNLSRTQIENARIGDILGTEVFEQTMRSKLERCFAGETIQYEQWMDYDTAGRRYVRVTYKPFRINAGDRVPYVLATVDDITQMKSAEDDLRRHALRMQLANQSAKIGIWEYNFENGILFWDKGMHAIFDPAGTEQSANKLWAASIHPEDQAKAERPIVEPRSIPLPYEVTFRIRRQCGAIRYIKACSTAVFTDQNDPAYIIGTNMDITEQVLHEEELRNSEQKAHAANRAKTQFLNTVNHELRTPLNAIIGPLELLELEELPDEASELLELIKPAANHLNDLINQILSLAKLEAGTIEQENSEITLATFIEDRMSIFSKNAERKGLEFRAEVAQSAPKSIYSDPRAITQILYNLVSNAIKFTQNGQIILRVDSENLNGIDYIRFIVTDTGIGIPKEDIDRILNAFEQVTPSGYSDATGTGLGLSIVTRLIEQLGGQMSIESALGSGSTFITRIPIHIQSKHNSQPQDNWIKDLGINIDESELQPSEIA